MAKVMKDEMLVRVKYILCCNFERAQVLADALLEELKDDKGLWYADDVTDGFVPDGKSVVEVGYVTLKDANRLDQKVRQLLSRKLKSYSYDPNYGVSYGSRGGHLTVNPITHAEF